MTDRENCPMRHENGNCIPCGGFCTAVNDEICQALHNAYNHGYYNGYYTGAMVRKPQKPLTVEELKEIYSIREDHVWPFDRKPPYLYLDLSIEKNDHLWIAWSIAVDFLVSGYRQYTVENYGKTWRCWAEKPTEEERMAAEWET